MTWPNSVKMKSSALRLTSLSCGPHEFFLVNYLRNSNKKPNMYLPQTKCLIFVLCKVILDQATILRQKRVIALMQDVSNTKAIASPFVPFGELSIEIFA